ncbi:MAG TPA: DUF2934 domain-containing protein [Burkholderiales bacterium]|nr:DUF2934 domain-containing protein [Burkholderiales bacterium]
MAAQEVKSGQTTPAAKSASLSGSRAEGQTRLSGEERDRMIAVAAYYKAQQRGFAAGGELDDWLAAEEEVKVLLEGVPAERAPAVAQTSGATSQASSREPQQRKSQLRI